VPLGKLDALAAADAPPERVRRDEERERLLAVDLHHGQELAVARLELRAAGDVDLLELEPKLGAQLLERGAGAVAEVAAGGAVEDDPRYG